MRARAPIRWAIVLVAVALIVVTGGTAVGELPLVAGGRGPDGISTAQTLNATLTNRPAALIASSNDYPDALAALPAAALRGGPLLLVTHSAIPPSTAAELTHVRPATIAVLGGTQAVDDSVVHALRGYTSGPVTRVGGRDHNTTTAAISAATFGPGVTAVYIASDRSFADVLVAGAAAARARVPLLLIARDGIAPSTERELTRLRPASIVIVGGIFGVSEKLAHLLATYTTGSVTREAGADEYDTAVAVSRTSFPTTASTVYVATGDTSSVSLADAVAAGLTAGPLLLVHGTCVPRNVTAEITRLNPTSVVVLGEEHTTSGAAVSLHPC